MKNKIIKLNEAYNKIRTGVKILERLYEKNNDVGYYLWKLKKIHGLLNKKILKLIKQEQMNEDFERLIIQLKMENNNGK